MTLQRKYVSLKSLGSAWGRPVTSLGHQGGEEFSERGSIFYLYPLVLTYAQHIFPGEAKNFGVMGLAWGLKLIATHWQPVPDSRPLKQLPTNNRDSVAS